MNTYYAIIPSHGCYGSGDCVRSVYSTTDRRRAIRRAATMTREHRRTMQKYGGTSGGYRVVETRERCRAGTVVAEYGHDADRLETVS